MRSWAEAVEIWPSGPTRVEKTDSTRAVMIMPMVNLRVRRRDVSSVWAMRVLQVFGVPGIRPCPTDVRNRNVDWHVPSVGSINFATKGLDGRHVPYRRYVIWRQPGRHRAACTFV